MHWHHCTEIDEQLDLNVQATTQKVLVRPTLVLEIWLSFWGLKSVFWLNKSQCFWLYHIAKDHGMGKTYSQGQIYTRQLDAIKKKIPTLHEDLQYDYSLELEELES